ncbi:MAG TPA: FAD binding domain-containing protein [Vicinamibacterales bacterium]
MPVDVNALALERPRSLKDALTMMAGDPRLVPLAGCTDVYVGLHFGTVADRRFIDLWNLKELRGISVERDVLTIGALTTYTDIIQSKIVQKRVPMLVAAAREVGGAQIQNRGTLGGNVANASPAGDTLPVLAAANARIVLRSNKTTRTVTFDSYYTGYRKSVRQPGELIVAIEIPRIDGRQWWRKVGTRRAQAISKIMIGAVRGRHVRIAFGSVASTVILARKTAAVLQSGGSIADAQAALGTEIAPIDDVRSTGEYRLKIAKNLVEQFWNETA